MSAHAQPSVVVNRVTQARGGVHTVSVILFHFIVVYLANLARWFVIGIELSGLSSVIMCRHSSRFLLAPPSISRTGCSAEKGDDLPGSIRTRARGWGPAPCQTLATKRSRCARGNEVGVACMRSKSPLTEVCRDYANREFILDYR